MKNQKKVSGTFYSRAILITAILLLGYGIYDLARDKSPRISPNNTGVSPVEPSINTLEPSMMVEHEDLEPEPLDQVTMADFTEEPLMSLSEFEGFLSKTQSELPLTTDFQKLAPEEVHHTPELLMVAGDQLGKVAQLLHSNPEFANAAQNFYLNCFIRDDLPTSIRALCLANHKNLRVSNGEHPEWTHEEVNLAAPEVLELATEIPEN